MISDNKPLDWDVVSLPIGQLVEVLFAWRREEDCTLRLFEVVRGNNSNDAFAGIKCRQLVCLRVAPPSISRKKDSCEVVSMDLDDAHVACLVEESLEREKLIDNQRKPVNSWLVAVSREDVVCAGNEGLLEDDGLKSHDLREVVLEHLLSGATGNNIAHNEMQEALHEYLEYGETSDVQISVRPKLVACGRGNFLFSAFVVVPSHDDEEDGTSIYGSWLFLFSIRSGAIIDSFYLERNLVGATYLFASRPFKSSSENAVGVLLTNVLVIDSFTIALLSVKIRRDGTANIFMNPVIKIQVSPSWLKINAALTCSNALLSTESQGSLPLLYIQGITASDGHDDDDNNDAIGNGSRFHSIEIGGPQSTVRNLVLIREHYVAVLIEEIDDNLLGRQYFSVVVIHIPTREEIYRCSLPTGAISVDALGDTLAMNVSNLGFVFTGGNTRDVARMSLKEHSETPGKNAKAKKKRLVSMVRGKHKPKQTPHSYSCR